MNGAYLQALGKLVSEQRKAEGLSVTKFALMTGISRPTVYSLEDGTGNPKYDTLMKIADGFGLSMLELFALCEEILDKDNPSWKTPNAGNQIFYSHISLPENPR